MSARRRAFRAWLVAAPVYVLTAVAPAGGLFRGRAYVDLDLYHRYAQGFLDGTIPYRDTFVEYPPGAFVVLLPPALVTEGHYRFLFKLLMAAVALGGLWCVARLLVELGAGTRRLALALGFVAVSPLLLGSVWLNSYDAWPAALTAGSLLALALGAACPGLLAAGPGGSGEGVRGLPRRARRPVRPCAARHARSRRGRSPHSSSRSPSSSGRSSRSRPAASGRAFARSSSEASTSRASARPCLLALDRLGLYDATVSGGSTAAKSRDLAGPLPDALATVSSLVLLVAVVAAWLRLRQAAGRRWQSLATAFAACVAAVLAASKILSPQYAEWLVFLVPLTAGAPGVAAALLAAAAFLLAEAWFHHYASIYAVGERVWLLLLRNLAFARATRRSSGRSWPRRGARGIRYERGRSSLARRGNGGRARPTAGRCRLRRCRLPRRRGASSPRRCSPRSTCRRSRRLPWTASRCARRTRRGRCPSWTGLPPAVRRTGRSGPARRWASPPEASCPRAPTPSSRSRRSPTVESEVEVPAAVDKGSNIRAVGKDIEHGEELVPAGSRLGAARIAALAAAGVAAVVCARRPRVAVLTTGTELRPAGATLGPGDVYEANGAMLSAQLRDSGRARRGARAGRRRRGAASRRDRGAVSSTTFSSPRAASRWVPTTSCARSRLSSGWKRSSGASRFRPGKPVSFGHRGDTLTFGLPGNPVSSFVTCELFVRPAVLALQGAADARATVRGRQGRRRRAARIRAATRCSGR